MSDSQEHTRLPGGVKIFDAFGIDVFLHWTWLLVAYYLYQQHVPEYHNPMWAMAEVLALFGIVLMHEFGHALACRSVGGKALHIMLWPLGGVAYVQPPFRPGAMLWSIIAGPLVNVALVPITWLAVYLYEPRAAQYDGDVLYFLKMVFQINLVLLIFNMLPIYPLDGGKVVWSLLWFFIGPSRSLTIASYLGFVGVAAGLGFAVMQQSIWLGAIAVFAGMQCKRGLEDAKVMKYNETLVRPRVPDMISCPACRRPPPVGPYWQCECGQPFDMPGENGRCPHCDRVYAFVVCPYCQHQASLLDWRTRPGSA
ncbi:MAG: M50 family metallopeptidase [Phycisphaerales bacterium]|nr:M50 family metallopeptidase [Phycisphaerales bacterium]MCB9857230.1 M50 family metallopeptidase [Phycisphaerales bacterium]MCB9863056.1 M50 family metallopeptidase [Phycisphaerales bacterium]